MNINLRRGDKLKIMRGPDADIETAWADEFVVSVEDEKLGCKVLLTIRGEPRDYSEWVGIYSLALWVEWAK